MKQKTKFKETEIGEIPEDWEVVEVGDQISLEYGKGLPKRKRENGNYPVFGSNGKIGTHNNFLEEGPGVIIGRKGSVGEIEFTKEDFWPIDTTYYVKINNEGDLTFWYYLLSNLKLDQMNSHSAVPGLNRNNVYRIKIPLPPLEEQRAIAKALSDLDDKIELNNRMNETLENISEAIFKHWFVDFEFPNEDGKPYKSSGGKMVYSEELDKEIPEGWEPGKISDVATRRKESLSPTKFPETKFHHYSYSAYDSDQVPNIERGDDILSNKYAVESDDVLFGKLNLRNPKVWYTGSVRDNSICSTEFVVLSVDDNFIPYVYLLLSFETVLNKLEKMSKGTSSSHQRVSPSDILSFGIVVPSSRVIGNFYTIVKKLLDKISKNRKEAIILSKIRDLLLPRLMSGKIRVPMEDGK